MSMRLRSFALAVEAMEEKHPAIPPPVIIRSSASGMCWEVGSVTEAVVTPEMELMGCEQPLGSTVILITTD